MDPLTALGAVASAVQIVQVISQTIGGLAKLREKLKNADARIHSLIVQLTTIKSAVSQLRDWAEYNLSDSADNQEYKQGVEVALEGCQAIMEVLSEEVSALTEAATGDNVGIGFRTRVRIVWNENMMKEHQDRLHAQVLALQLLLQACQCRSSSEQIELLRKTESRMIIQKVASDTASLRTTMSSVTSQASSSWTNRQSIGETIFDFDDNVVNAAAYRRVLQHSRTTSEELHPVNRNPSKKTINTASDEGYASGITRTVTPSPSLGIDSAFGNSQASLPIRPYEPVRPGDGRSKSVSFGATPRLPEENVRRWQSSSAQSSQTSSAGSKRDKFRSALRRLNTASRASLTPISPRGPTTSPVVGTTRGKRGRESDFNTSINLTSAEGATAPLIVKAAQSGSRFDVDRLLQSGHDIEARHLHTRRNALAVASHCGKEDIVDLLIQNNARLNVPDSSGSTALHLAASRGHCAVLELLVLENVDVEAKDSHNRTALWVAANQGQLEATQLLIASKARVNARADNQMTALHVAAKRGDREIVELLISHGADMEARDGSMMAAIHYSCEGGHLDVIQLLLDNKANADAIGGDRRTPLICAAAMGQFLATDLLLRRKVSYKNVDDGGMTALHWAAFNGHVEIVDLLSQKKGSLSMTNAAGRTALHLASQNSQFAVVELILRKDPVLEIRCNSGFNPLHYACMADSPEIVRLLLTSGANLEAQTEFEQRRPIHIAAAGGSIGLLTLLCEKGASLDSRDAEGDRALCIACRYGHVAAVQKLLDYGSPLYLRFGPRLHEDSPMCLAVMGGHLPVVTLLVSRGASVFMKDDRGWQPLRYAAYYGHLDVLRFLLGHNATLSENSADFSWSKENMVFADMPEQRKKEVLDLLRGVQPPNQSQSHFTIEAYPPHPPMIPLMNDSPGYITSLPLYPSSSFEPSDQRNTVTAVPPQELPSTIAEGLPSSRSATPERMRRTMPGLPLSSDEDMVPALKAQPITPLDDEAGTVSAVARPETTPTRPVRSLVRQNDRAPRALESLGEAREPGPSSSNYRPHHQSSSDSSRRSTPRSFPRSRTPLIRTVSPAVSSTTEAEFSSAPFMAYPHNGSIIEAPRPVAPLPASLTAEAGDTDDFDRSDTESISSVYTAPEDLPRHEEVYELAA